MDNVYTIYKDPGIAEVISVSGSSVGPRGLRGEKGEDGHTPVRGVDYWTQADQEQIVEDVLNALPNSDEEEF